LGGHRGRHLHLVCDCPGGARKHRAERFEREGRGRRDLREQRQRAFRAGIVLELIFGAAMRPGINPGRAIAAPVNDRDIRAIFRPFDGIGQCLVLEGSGIGEHLARRHPAEIIEEEQGIGIENAICPLLA
jgi:hypothetical protein